MAIVEAIKYVDKVVPQEDKNKFGAWERYHFDKMFVGSDWKGTPQWNKFEEEFAPLGVEIVYLQHTDGISSTKLTNVIKNMLNEENKIRLNICNLRLAYIGPFYISNIRFIFLG